MFRIFQVLLIAMLTLSPAAADEHSDNINVYIFGNSLVNHASDTNETTIPHWLHLLAQAGNKEFKVDGQWGFMSQFAKSLPPTANWSFKLARGTWDSDTTPFARSKFNTIFLTPANFIQYQSADTPYDGDNPSRQSPLSAALTVFDWVSSQKKGLTYYIFEGWTDMGPFAPNFPPTSSGYQKFHKQNMGPTRDWFVDFVKMIKEKRPDLDVRLIPIGSTLSKFLTETELKDVKPEDLFTDNAPHGTPSTYFLASLITYAAFYGEPAPKSFTVPSNLSPKIAATYNKLAQIACEEVAKFTKCEIANE